MIIPVWNVAFPYMLHEIPIFLKINCFHFETNVKDPGAPTLANFVDDIDHVVISDMFCNIDFIREGVI